MTYYIQYDKQGPVIQCSATKYYNARLKAFKTNAIIEIKTKYKGDYYKKLIIL